MEKPIYKTLYFQVLCGLALGVVVGVVAPSSAAQLKPLGDLFIKSIKMLIAPLIFVVLTVGIAQLGDLRKVGRIGGKAFLYFEAVTTAAMLVGFGFMYLFQPGAGMNIDASTLDPSSVKAYIKGPVTLSIPDFLLGLVPNTFVGAFAEGNSLQVLVLSLLFGTALGHVGEAGTRVTAFLNDVVGILFRVVAIVMWLAPMAAFGAIAFTVGRYGVGTLLSLAKMVGTVYAANLVFVAVILGTICRMSGFSLWKFLKYIREELLIVFGTCSTEPVFPEMMRKLERLGCQRPVIGLVFPFGYSFNLDGTVLYIAMAVVFIAQAINQPLAVEDLGLILAIMTVTTKGVAGVAGIGFVTLAATLSLLGGLLPVEGLALLIGVDRFMSEARAITSLVGNGVAVLAVARWSDAVDMATLRAELDRGNKAESDLQRAPEDCGRVAASSEARV
ncbi:C4-dicarboxylate transporter DctA [Azospirillum sp. sgz302134]